MTGTLRSINCTACGAGLDVLGGGRVATHICPYCGTELDAQDNYRALRKLADMTRPDTPLAIGMTGRIKGVEWTIIGIIAYEERWGAKVARWVDHQLYSPTHGYAWLTLEDGHLIFTRRIRTAGDAWMSVNWVEAAENRPTVRALGQRFAYYETSTSRITFAEGEFTWAPDPDETLTTVSAMSERAMLSFAQTEGEREVELSEYLPQDETWASFGVTDPPRPRGVHPLQPYVKGRDEDFLKRAAAVFAALALALTVGFWVMSGHKALDVRDIAVADLPQEYTFEVDEPGRLALVKLGSDVNNGWAWIELAVSDPEGVPLFEAGRIVEKYRGRDSEGSWTEGSRIARLRFRPELAGTYTVELDVTEAGKWYGAGTPKDGLAAVTRLSLEVWTGVASGFWTGLAAFAFGVFALYQWGRKWRHDRRRWRGSDWTDDDD